MAEKILGESKNDTSPEINAPFSIQEVNKAISTIKSTIGYYPHENIHPLMMKKNHPSFLEIIKELGNLCLQNGKFPMESTLDHKIPIS